MYRQLSDAEAAVVLARHQGLELPPQGVQLCDRDKCYLIFRLTTGEQRVIDLGTQRLPGIETEEDWWGTFWGTFGTEVAQRTGVVLKTVAGLPAQALNEIVKPLNPVVTILLVAGGVGLLVWLWKK